MTMSSRVEKPLTIGAKHLIRSLGKQLPAAAVGSLVGAVVRVQCC